LLTTSAHDSPTNNGDKDDERGNNSDYLILRHMLTLPVAVRRCLKGMTASLEVRRERNPFKLSQSPAPVVCADDGP
jgi:hypothetical protein